MATETLTMFVLFLFLGSEPIEWTPHHTVSECLGVKRKIERNVGKKAAGRYSCKEETVEVTDRGGEYEITKFIEVKDGRYNGSTIRKN